MGHRLLLTGGTGFFGRALLNRMATRPDIEVHAVTRHMASEPIAEVATPVRWHRCDLLDAESTIRTVRHVKPTHLLHLAWHVVPGSHDDVANIDWVPGGLTLLQAFADNGGQRAVVVGSCYEYDVSHGWCREHRTPTVPHTTYGRSKLALSILSNDLLRPTRTSLAWARVFFAYGPHERPDRLVSHVAQSLLRGEFAETTAGRQVRDYLHSDDVAAALLALLDSGVEGPVNIGSGRGVTVAEVVETVARHTGGEGLLRRGARMAAPNEPTYVVADVERLRDEVGFEPRWSLVEGLRDTVAWWASRPSIGSAAVLDERS